MGGGNQYQGVTLHRDGAVTFWDVYAQQWVRSSAPSDSALASMPEATRARVLRHLSRAGGAR